jgi:hypothetical protein
VSVYPATLARPSKAPSTRCLQSRNVIPVVAPRPRGNILRVEMCNFCLEVTLTYGVSPEACEGQNPECHGDWGLNSTKYSLESSKRLSREYINKFTTVRDGCDLLSWSTDDDCLPIW